MSYRRITFQERMSIFRMHYYAENLKISEIAYRSGINPSTISRKLHKSDDVGSYNPFLAKYLSLKQRRYQCPELKISSEDWKIIKTKLELRWSPDEIAHWWNRLYPEKSMSGRTIYNYVHFHMRGELKKLALNDLRRRGKPPKRLKNDGRGKLKDMTLIDERPPEVEEREVPGHWEGDLIIGKDHKSAICVIVERQTRYIQMDLLLKYDAAKVRKTIERRFKRIEPHLRKTLTLDQGKENNEHNRLSEEVKIDVFFCHPHSPWEKATCENTNGLIRDMLYEIDDIRNIDQYYVGRSARLLNERPQKTLDYKTLKQVLAELR